jgi:CheY-like chemotaxis protein
MRKLESILLIDDDETNNFLNQRLFNRLGLSVRVKVISKARQAYNYLYNISQQNYDLTNPDYFRPDLILLDINMPVMDGFEFLDLYMKLEESFRNQIVLSLLSTSTHPSDLQKARQYGIEFLTKPLTVDKLSSLVSNYFAVPAIASGQPTASETSRQE